MKKAYITVPLFIICCISGLMAQKELPEYPQRMIDEARKELLDAIEVIHQEKVLAQKKLDGIWAEQNKKTARLEQPDLPKATIKSLKQELKLLKRKEKTLKKQVRSADKRMSKYSRVVYGNPDNMVEFVQEMQEEESVVVETVKIVPSAPIESPVLKQESNIRPDIQSFDAMKLAAYNPPNPPCNIAVERYDEIAGIQVLETEPSLFFGATSDQLRPYIKGRDYLECYGNLISGEGGLLSLSLEFRISSTTAQREYGWLEKNSILTIKLLNGKLYKFFCARTDRGKVNVANKTTVYESQYKIPINFKKDLMTYPVDQVRVVWSTGYEDYDVYEVDFLMNQLNCLNQKGF